MDADLNIFETIDLDSDERAMREGEADGDAGRVVPHAKVVEWLRTWGTADDQPPPAEWFE